MAVNKVIFGGKTVVDLTSDSVSADKMLVGITAHDKSGENISGSIETFDGSYECSDDNTGGVEVILQNKTITPLPRVQEVTADEGYTALEKVTVQAIPDGYVKPSGSINITENGTYTITKYNAVHVNVPSEEPVLQEKNVTKNGTVTPDAGYDGLSRVNVSVPTGSLDIELSLLTRTITDYSNTTLTKLGAYAFSGTRIINLNLPALTTIAGYAFYECTSLKKLVLPSLTDVPYNGFRQYKGLIKGDFHKIRNIAQNGFYQCTNLETLIIRTNSVCTLFTGSVFTGSKIQSGTGYIYVPSALVDSYKAATNWSAYADQFRAIEDYPDICG